MNDNSPVKKKFLSLASFDELAELLDLTPAGLRFLCHSKPYETFTLAKKNGESRTISSPTGPLKTVQRKLSAILLEVYGGRAPVHGFARGRSIKSNAMPHVKRRHVFNIDLENFFPSIHYGRVQGMFASKPYSLPDTVARALTQLCCNLGSLPQGAPTSPIVSNLICGRLDAKLKLLARRYGCRYTRYADDITFSSDDYLFPNQIAARNGTNWEAGAALAAAIIAEGFTINATKTCMRVIGSRQVVTGLVVNKTVNVSQQYLKSVRGMIGSIEKRGLEQAEEIFHQKYETKQSPSKPKSFEKVLAGRVNYIGFIKGWDSSTYVSFAARLQKLNIQLRKHPAMLTRAASRSNLYRAVWLIEAGISEEYAVQQSTGFSLERYGIVTAAHAVGEYDQSGKWKAFDYVRATQPHLNNSGTVYQAKVLEVHPHADLALIEYPAKPLVAFQRGAGKLANPKDGVSILGFPHHHIGDSCTDQDFMINAHRVYSGIHHRVVAGAIIKGNSGGPVLNERNEVIGIALKGQEIPAHFSDKDSLSSFAIAETLDVLLNGDKDSPAT